MRTGRWLRDVQDSPILMAIVLGGILFLVQDIDRAPVQLFDEHYYLDVARNYNAGSLVDPQWGSEDPRPWNFEHPPLAKFAIALSIRMFGDNPLGWRAPSILVGAAGLYAAFLLGRNLFWSRGAGLACAFFLALDPMYFIHARLAMLEIFPTVFLTFAAAFLLDRERPRLLASGAFLGLAVATKYAALFAGPVIVLVAYLRLAGISTGQRFKRLGLYFVAVPAAVVLAAYLPYLWIWTKYGGLIFAIRELIYVQSQMFVYGYGAQLTHDYQSGPVGWFLLTKPIYYYCVNPPGPTVGWIYTFGNPVTWWSGLAAILIVLARQWQRLLLVGLRPVGFEVTGLVFLGSLLPYFFVDRILLNFYATQFTPLLAAGAAGLVTTIYGKSTIQRIATISFIVLALAAFFLYRPLATGEPIPATRVDWLFDILPWTERLPVSDCSD